MYLALGQAILVWIQSYYQFGEKFVAYKLSCIFNGIRNPLGPIKFFLFTFPLGKIASQFGIPYRSHTANGGFIAHMLFSGHKSNTLRELSLSNPKLCDLFFKLIHITVAPKPTLF